MRVKPMMILLAVLAVLLSLNVFSFTVYGFVIGLIYGIIYAYLFVVVYSLYATFKEEHERGPESGAKSQYHPNGVKV